MKFILSGEQLVAELAVLRETERPSSVLLSQMRQLVDAFHFVCSDEDKGLILLFGLQILKEDVKAIKIVAEPNCYYPSPFVVVNHALLKGVQMRGYWKESGIQEQSLFTCKPHYDTIHLRKMQLCLTECSSTTYVNPTKFGKESVLSVS